MNAETEDARNQPAPRQGSAAWKWLGRLFRLTLLALIIGGAGAISYYWVANPPTAQRRPPRPEAVLVETLSLTHTTEAVTVQAMGTVIPAQSIQLAARVAGQIAEVDARFVPGGIFTAGEVLLRVDPKDYQLAVQQQEANLTRAESDVAIEMGQQEVARREYELLMGDAEDADLSLMLRRPQLEARQAAVSAARAALDKARIDLERTAVKAPFDAVIQTRNADLGAFVSPGSPLATLVGLDVFWVEAAIPVDDVRWICVPDEPSGTGSPARIHHQDAAGGGAFRPGTVVKLLPHLEPHGRMARVLVSVPRPLMSDAPSLPPLLLGMFVHVEIEGDRLEKVFKVARTNVHGNSRVWIMQPDGTLDIRRVEVVWGARDEVFVRDGLREGERLIVSNLASPVQGMLLRTGAPSETEAAPGNAGP